MNELIVCFGDQSWIYWKTNEVSVDFAIEELFQTMENSGINADNLTVTSAELRDKKEKIIDEY